MQYCPRIRGIAPIRETLEQLKQTEKLLKKYHLLNTKYLIKRNNIFYFCIKVNNSVIKRSLKTSNLVLANILKYKILERLGRMDLDKFLKRDSGYQVQKVGGILQVIPENEFEAKDENVDAIAKAIENKTHAMSKKHPTKINSPKNSVQRTKDTLKSTLEPYYERLKTTQQTQNKKSRAYMKYRQALDYLYEYFGEKKLVKDISQEDAENFQIFLTKVPKSYKLKKDLQGKSIKLLIEKKSSLLDKYEKQQGRTVDEVIVKCKKYFEHLVNKKYIPENPFLSDEIRNLGSKKKTSRKEFKEEELKEVFEILKKEDSEYTNFILFLLYCGFRRGEALELRVEDIDLSMPYVDTEGNKTINAKRVVPIHDDIVDMISKQIEGKEKEDYLFFDGRKHLKTRVETLGKELNAFIKEAIIRLYPPKPNETEEEKTLRLEKINAKKDSLDLHSLRKNYAQEVFFMNIISDTNLKALIGHAQDSGDVTDNNYLMGKRDFQYLKGLLNKVDFSKYIPKDIYQMLVRLEQYEDFELDF